MPTYSQNMPLVPTQYVPIDYSHDAQFQLAEAQAAATNIAKVRSRYEDLLGMDLTNDKSKEGLSSFMKGAEEDLRKVSGMDMMVGSNVTQALNILKPLTDLDGQYGYIVVDNIFTKKVDSQKSIASQQKLNPKDNNYNADSDELLDIMKARFRNTNNVDEWKYLLNSVEDYVPYYDTQKEDMDLMSKFQPDQFESDTPDGAGRIINSKNSSAYASKIETYLNQNHSAAYKRQKEIEAKVQFGRVQMNAFDPTTKMYNGTEVYNHFNGILDNIKKTQVDIYTNEKLNLERQSKLLPKTSDGLDEYKSISNRISLLDQNIKNIQEQKIDKDIFMNPFNYKQAEATAVNLLGIDESMKKSQSLEHLNMSTTMKDDAVYWNGLRYNLDVQKFNYEKEKDEANRKFEMDKLMVTLGMKKLLKDGTFVNDDGFNAPQNKALITNEKDSPEEQGQATLEAIQSGINGEIQGGYLKYVDKIFGINFSTAVKTLQDQDKKNKLEGKTWGELIHNNLYGALGTSSRLNDYILATYKKVYKNPNATFKNIESMQYNDVLNLVIGGIKSPADQAVLTKALSGKDKAEAQALISQAKSVSESLQAKLRQAAKGTIYENANIDPSQVSNKDYMQKLAEEERQKYFNSFKGKPVKIEKQDISSAFIPYTLDAVVTDIKYENGKYYAYGTVKGKAWNSKNQNLGEVSEVFPGADNKKYMFDFKNESGDMLLNRVNQFYKNIYANKSSFEDLQYEQTSSVPELITAGTSPDKESRDQWHAYKERNLDLIRSSDNSQKPIYSLVSEFPGAFIAHKDANGVTFTMNDDFVNVSMTKEERERLFNKLDEQSGSANWYNDRTNNIDEAHSAVNDILEKDPNAFTVSIKGMNLEKFKTDAQSKYLYAGGRLALDKIAPQTYTDASGKPLPVQPISLQVQNLAASTPDEANPMFSGEIVLPLYDATSQTFKRNNSGELRYQVMPGSTFNAIYSVDQIMANSSEVIKNIAAQANAQADIIDFLNNHKTINTVKDLVQYGLNNSDKILLQNLSDGNYLDNDTKNKLLSRGIIH